MPKAAPALLCVPFAGAGPSAFRLWPDALPGVDVVAAYLPGRERRFAEPPERDIGALTRDARAAVPWIEDRRYAIFGHSFGALVAFELARSLRRAGLPPPLALFVSGCRAPELPPVRLTHDLPDDEFVRALDELGGTPREVLATPELLELLLPLLRADFAAAQTYECAPDEPLDCAIDSFCGDADTGVSVAESVQWERHTRRAFRLHVVPGDHFFINADLRTVTDLIGRVLVPGARAPA